MSGFVTFFPFALHCIVLHCIVKGWMEGSMDGKLPPSIAPYATILYADKSKVRYLTSELTVPANIL